MVWVNTHSNKSNPHGGWEWREETIPGTSRKEHSYSFRLSALNQQWLRNHNRYCACCKNSRNNDNTIAHYFCSSCSGHAICCSCEKRFIPHAGSFLRYCSGCWKLERSLLEKNSDFQIIKHNGYYSESNCHLDQELA